MNKEESDPHEPEVRKAHDRPPKKGTANTALIVTLAAAGVGVSGKVSVLSHWTE